MGLKINLLLNSTPSEEDFYLMPPNVHGFVLRGKKWGESLILPYSSSTMLS